MNKKLKRKFVKKFNEIKKSKIFQLKCPISKKNFVLTGISLLILILVGVVAFIGIKQFKELREVNAKMETIGTNVQLGYHREISLIERLDIVDTKEFKENCEEFSYDCLYQGSDIRKEFLSKLESESFDDEDIEVLNMVSSIDINVKQDSEEYEMLIGQYDEISSRLPLSVFDFLTPDREPLL